ncbi:MAG TPA: diguanylate cyclase [Steroidobacteraceae bacterium]|jgi:diguanylate cyclase (GGDEF)-like protein
MVGQDDSRYTAPAGLLLPRRFPEPIEIEYIQFSLRMFRPGIRAWHSAALCLAVLLLTVGTVLHGIGYAYPVLPLISGRMEPATLWLLGLAVGARAGLCGLSWRSDYVTVYGKWALPLAVLGHACVNAIFARESFGPHPGYLAAIAVYAFGASFLTGLQLRQSLLVNGAALCVLVGYAWGQPLPPMVVWSVIGQVAFAMLMASLVAVTLERSVRALYLENRRVGEMAARDGLTGLKNRRAFDEHLRRVWQLALRDRRSLGVLLIDVDFFKAFNDSMGHQAGDAALQRIAGVVAATARRPLDLSARYGGEELAIILFDVTREYVAATAERVQRMVEELRITHPESSVAPVVTVSTGVAYVRPTADRSPQGAILLADRGLYAAKRAGRNQIAFLDRDQEMITTGVFDPGNPAFAKTASR